MKRLLVLVISLIGFISTSTADEAKKFAQEAVLADFISEKHMKADLLQMLADFSSYLKNDFQECVAPNDVGEACGCFRGENTMGNDERGVRPNADLSMICAFLVKYGRDHQTGQPRVSLPADVSWNDLETMAMKSLVFAYSTHKANKLKVCAGNRYWGSTAANDAVWESSLWAMSVAYSAFFQWDKLTSSQKDYIYKLLKAECNYELNRSIPTGFSGDTKAEENGWEADVLAATLGLFPNDELAPQWFARLREFAINSYSQENDRFNDTVIDPHYDQITVKDLYQGKNLYDDYTLQNHHYFHTSYQNVVIQELGEAALALKLFQQQLYGKEQWQTNALMHNNDRVMKEVLYWLALSDGELAMPNGNDWSLFLYDQITSYSTNACFLRDPHALMLENLAYKMIKARQKSTADGTWLLRADVGARRMGVEAHRVMMTWLMHEVLSTAGLKPTKWEAFTEEYSAAKIFESQNIVRAASKERFVCFSWSEGLKSYTGYISPNIQSLTPEQSNLIVPFRANNTGNFLGWYEVEGRKTNAKPVVAGNYQLLGNSFVMNGELNTNDDALNQRFAIYATPGNAVIYINNVRANENCTIKKSKNGLTAISVDEMTQLCRTFYYPKENGDLLNHEADCIRLDGQSLTTLDGNWVNIDHQLGIVTNSNQMAFGERANNNSVMTAKLYSHYADQPREVKAHETVDSHYVVYYSNTTAEQTLALSKALSTPMLWGKDAPADGWGGVLAPDGAGSVEACPYYLLLSNFQGNQACRVAEVNLPLGAPVFTADTQIAQGGSNATFECQQNASVVNTLRFFLSFSSKRGDDSVGGYVKACQETGNPYAINIKEADLDKGASLVVTAITATGKQVSTSIANPTNKRIELVGNKLKVKHMK